MRLDHRGAAGRLGKVLQRGTQPSVRQAILPDWLPAGLHSLVKVIGIAPRKSGPFVFRPSLLQGDKTFETTGGEVTIEAR